MKSVKGCGGQGQGERVQGQLREFKVKGELLYILTGDLLVRFFAILLIWF